MSVPVLGVVGVLPDGHKHLPALELQGSLPSEDAALILLFSLVASGLIKLRRIDGWRKIAEVLSQHTAAA